MPYVEEQDYNNLLEHQENYNTLVEDLNENKDQKRKLKVLSIILGFLFLLTLLAFLYYMFSYSKKYVKIEDSQQIIETDSIKSYQQKITSLEQMLENGVDVNANGNQNSIAGKIIYAVQIGAFKESDMRLFSSNLVNFKEISNKGYNKYALGNFETLSEAQEFRSALVNLGFSDSFIASYKNDKRLKIEEVN